tara:strand:+ start:117 stop:746 length:630 start_codon:yes stop_codon:yes gene_type:complete
MTFELPSLANLTSAEITELNYESEIFRYDAINEIIRNELKSEIRAEDIIYNGLIFPRDEQSTLLSKRRRYLNTNPLNILSKDSVGIYVIWEDTKLSLQKSVIMRALYIGEGIAQQRLNKHHSEKDLINRFGNYAVSYYEIERRFALYLESLFLEHYKFTLNTEHNYGNKELFALISEEAVTFGNENFIERVTMRNHRYSNLIDKDIDDI